MYRPQSARASTQHHIKIIKPPARQRNKGRAGRTVAPTCCYCRPLRLLGPSGLRRVRLLRRLVDGVPYFFKITCHITINLFEEEEEARDLAELPPTTQQNSGSNAEVARGNERNSTIQQSTCRAMQQHTHLGGGGSRGSRKGMRRWGRRRRRRQRRGDVCTPHGPSSPFPQRRRRRRRRSVGILLSYSRR